MRGALSARGSCAGLATAAVVAACTGTISGGAPSPVGAATSDGATGGGGEAGPAAVCPNVVTSIFTPRCAVAPCHTTISPAGSLDLQSPNIYARLVGATGPFGGTLIATDHDPSASLFYQVLEGVPPAGYNAMPLSGAPLTADELSCVRAWIQNDGAVTDGGVGDAIPQSGEAGDGATCHGTELTLLNHDSGCAVSIAGQAASTSSSQITCVLPGTVTLTATAEPGFEVKGKVWHGTAGDTAGAGETGSVAGSGSGATTTATVTLTAGTKCVAICCPFADGSGCSAASACPP